MLLLFDFPDPNSVPEQRVTTSGPLQKLYFLNSKIVGDRIKTPFWLTLLGLILGEKLMGIPGMILAPVVLHYIKVEASRNKVSDLASEEADERKAA